MTLSFSKLNEIAYLYENAVHGVTTGAEQVVLDGMLIDSPESVAEHMEKYEFPMIDGFKYYREHGRG